MLMKVRTGFFLHQATNETTICAKNVFNMLEISKHYLICAASERNLCAHCSVSNFNDRKTITNHRRNSEMCSACVWRIILKNNAKMHVGYSSCA